MRCGLFVCCMFACCGRALCAVAVWFEIWCGLIVCVLVLVGVVYCWLWIWRGADFWLVVCVYFGWWFCLVLIWSVVLVVLVCSNSGFVYGFVGVVWFGVCAI